MPDAEYWRGRFEQIEKSQHRDAQEVFADVQAMYAEATREIEEKISVWYQRFADNNGIVDMAEARRLLNSNELAEFKWTVDEYIRRGRENGVSADWSKQLENASARFHVSRYEALRLDLRQQVEMMFGESALEGDGETGTGLNGEFEEHMQRVYRESYYHSAYELQRGTGVGWNISGVDSRQLRTVLRRPWQAGERNFSDRLWQNKSSLIGELQRILQRNLVLGGNMRRAVEEMSHRMGVSQTQSARLLYTESAYFQSVAQQDCFRELGVEKYQFVATLDDRTSEVCREMDGQVFDMKDYAPGATAPPMHPWCRSVTAPYYDDIREIGQRAARNGQGTYFVPRNTTYREWMEGQGRAADSD